MEERKYLLVIEKEGNAYGGYFPDLPGCVATGNSADDIIRLAREALEAHLHAMVEDGDEIPEPSQSAYLSVRLPTAGGGGRTLRAA